MAYWENREALRLSMKCYSSFVNLSKDDKNRIDRRDALLQKKTPSKNQLQKWFHDFTKIIEETTHEKIVDEGLLHCYEDFDEDVCAF